MGLIPLPLAVLSGTLVLACLALPAAGNFAAESGFSGRKADCSACHNRPLVTAPPAQATVTGLPAAYTAGATYLLEVRVSGGPEPLPAPAPQGGFEIEAGAGSFLQPPGMEDLLRQPAPHVVTYEPEGTLRRDWQVAWTAPGLGEEPRPARLWLAAVSASGNHVVATNASDGGEFFDSVATLRLTVPPSKESLAAWAAVPLRSPTAAVRTGADTRAGPATVEVDGQLVDGNATTLRHRIDGQTWSEREVAPAWRIAITGLAPGDHTLEYQSAGANRTSPVQSLAIPIAGPDGRVPREAPSALFPSAAVGLLAAALLRRTR